LCGPRSAGGPRREARRATAPVAPGRGGPGLRQQQPGRGGSGAASGRRRGHDAVADRGGGRAMRPEETLRDADRERHQWQAWGAWRWRVWVRGFGEEGQRRLKGASVLVSRVGGVGGSVASQLAAAGVGRLVLAHAGNLRLDDLNRQLLMTTAGVGTPRADLA